MAETEFRKLESVCADALGTSPSKPKQPGEQKGEETGGKRGQSRQVKEPRHMGTRPSSGGSSRRLQHHGSRGHLEVKRRASLPPDRDRRRHKPESTPGKQHWERDSHSKHTGQRVKDRRSHPRSPVRPIKRRRSGDTTAAANNSPKRRTQHFPEAGSSRTPSPLSRVMARMGALEVALEELRAPGGAFLAEPSSSREPGVSQRAWLSWQLSHAGAALHWTMHTVNAILAERLGFPDIQGLGPN
ncbi:CLK4-associating serine/arginine rich protein-like [Mesocricetus auratus]|uniref:CLK4-associating serine/arginine rich protein-like n=1 Tax=Mesocricetus auratus TaxID=10036 RepID=A0ABM2WX81_MESAU|nr:CLK4-associating serine/arginine rich protein-like [Mesocricetus auratus]XP_040593588.1 CLK4-associating serine/arginine rich protein-like [Mesocricetus auratus]XP_040593593.1 CLK4-associating serine/arginine rich protein-like [Mesocricetus auratus]XP_040593598.1 CLK4-associating serine/arginine rich protein-like [Mesocricetus auratus]XP_040597902.1 CLK4-associating serine/arginine rich protein-like [Mesocricetus auratus]